MEKNKLVCSNCGKSDVSVLAWVDANTNKYKKEGTEDMWCESCNEHYELVFEKDFFKQSKFKQLSKQEWDKKTSDSMAYIETELGFHIALDITFMDQVDDFTIILPTGEEINTKYIR